MRKLQLELSTGCRCVQVLHIGPCDRESETVEQIKRLEDKDLCFVADTTLRSTRNRDHKNGGDE